MKVQKQLDEIDHVLYIVNCLIFWVQVQGYEDIWEDKDLLNI